MKPEQEIRKQAIEECIGVVSDFGTTRQGVIDKLLSLLPPEPTVVRDRDLEESIHNLRIEIKQGIEMTSEQSKYSLKFLDAVFTELLSLRTAKAGCIHTALDRTWKCLNCGKQIEQGHGKPEQAEPYQWKAGDEFEVKEGCTNLYNNVKGGYQGVIEETDYAHPNYSIYDGTYLFRPQDLILVKSAKPEKAEPVESGWEKHLLECYQCSENQNVGQNGKNGCNYCIVGQKMKEGLDSKAEPEINRESVIKLAEGMGFVNERPQISRQWWR